MTRGSRALDPNASIYDLEPLVLFDRFAWSQREAVLLALKSLLATGLPRWSFGGAYLFWAQVPDTQDGNVLYIGEARDLAQRQAQHLLGPGNKGNKFSDLSAHFALHPPELCGLAALVIPPASLSWLYPPDEPPTLVDNAAKEAGESLEGLLLRASRNLSGSFPPFNSRADASKYRHDSDAVRYQGLIRYLLDHPDATMDFVTFRIRTERLEATTRLRAALSACEGIPAAAPRTGAAH